MTLPVAVAAVVVRLCAYQSSQSDSGFDASIGLVTSPVLPSIVVLCSNQISCGTMDEVIARYERGEGLNPRRIRRLRRMTLRSLRRWLRSGPSVGSIPEGLRSSLKLLEDFGWPIDVAHGSVSSLLRAVGRLPATCLAACLGLTVSAGRLSSCRNRSVEMLHQKFFFSSTDVFSFSFPGRLRSFFLFRLRRRRHSFQLILLFTMSYGSRTPAIILEKYHEAAKALAKQRGGWSRILMVENDIVCRCRCCLDVVEGCLCELSSAQLGLAEAQKKLLFYEPLLNGMLEIGPGRGTRRHRKKRQLYWKVAVNMTKKKEENTRRGVG